MFVYNSEMISQDFHNKVAVCQALVCWEIAGANPDRKNTQAL